MHPPQIGAAYFYETLGMMLGWVLAGVKKEEKSFHLAKKTCLFLYLQTGYQGQQRQRMEISEVKAIH